MGVRRVVVASLVAITLTSCGAAAEPPPIPPAPTTETPPSIDLPPRQRDIPVDDLDPCALLTEVQRSELGLTGRVAAGSSPNDLVLGSIRDCSFADESNLARFVGVTLASNLGIERFTLDDVVAEVVVIDVLDQPALIVRPPNLAEVCSVVVDAAAGELIDVQYALGPSEPIDSQQAVCDDAIAVATAVVESATTT